MKNFIKNNAIILHKVLNGMADNLVKVFIPLIILKNCADLNLCVLYLALYSLFTGILNFTLIKLLRKKPLTMILLHILPYCILQFCISLIGYFNVILITFYAFLSSLGQTLYSVPANNYFMFEHKKTNAGKMEMGTNIGKILMILIGGLIINSGSVTYILLTCIVASILYILSVIPLISIRDNYQYVVNKDVIEKPTKNTFSKKDILLFRIYHISFGIYQILIDTILPVFLFINELQFASIVYILALIEIIKILFNIIAQKSTGKSWSKYSVMTGILIFAVGSIMIFIIKNSTAIFILSTIISSTIPLVFIPNMNKFCSKIKTTSDPQFYMSIRDVEIFSLRPFAFASMLCFNMLPAFIICITSSLVMLTLNFHKDFN